MWFQEVGSTVCVNPGRMAKGLVGGTYARVSVSRREDSIENEKALPSVVGQIIRVWIQSKLWLRYNTEIVEVQWWLLKQDFAD